MSLAYLEPPFTSDLQIDQLPYITNRRHQPIFVTITPAIAEAWLARVPETQRSVKRGAIDQYKKDMLANRWKIDYSPYRFDKNGFLIDGQHRLLAIRESGITVREQAVVFGLDPEDYETLDQGTKRNFADTLKYYGYPNFVLLSAITYRLYDWEKSGTFRKVRERPAQHELLQSVRTHEPEMQDALKVGRRVSMHVPPFINSVAAMVFLLCNRIDSSDAEYFFDRLIDGQGLVVGDPIYALRNKWAVNAARKREDTPDYIQGAHLLKTWNFYRAGRNDVELIQWKSGGQKPEAFPQPK